MDHLRNISIQAFELIYGIDATRNLVDQYFRAHPSTAVTHGQWFPVKTGHLSMEWIIADGADPNRRILYIHGGSWIAGSLAGYRAFLSRISQAAGAVILSIDYRLAPEHPFPAGLNDCIHAYQWMLENGPEKESPASAAFLMGDSAGGNLALATLLKIKDFSRPLPKAVVAISPATDLTCGSLSLITRALVDPIINPVTLPVLIPLYLGMNAEPQNPYVSPLFGNYAGMPPLLIQVGDLEVLLDDSIRLASHAAGQGCDVALDIWDGMPHAFQGFAPFLPEASEAINKIGRFIHQH